ncbi:Integrator complex subunit 11 [Gaertneriomyces sp. JEL0708]|nr:Integrator complex subunit 11 [Gaertneriomyces sp. JEL0708]
MGLRLLPLGAGQDVGRSCVLLTIANKTIMFDCGMHMGYNDSRRFPDFSYLSRSLNFDGVLDAVVISHFHLDHCGALPYFTEKCGSGYSGPIYMTYPTRAIAPLLLEDMRKVAVERKGETDFFTQDDIRRCMKKVIPVDLGQRIVLSCGVELTAYYAGHVLGAAMFHAKYGAESVVYTGDYNMTPDRHLGSAWLPPLRPDLLITETTYATFTRSSKRGRERSFLHTIHQAVAKGGKVLIPVFALGRAQELCILVEDYWSRTESVQKVPIYFSAGLTERANEYYKLFISWTSEKIKKTFVDRNMFDFRHIKPFDMKLADEPGPCVLFASPGMLHAGTSLEVFKKWCWSPLNTVILPGYCVAGTVGAKVLSGEKTIQIDRYTKVEVKMAVKNLSFSAHADQPGIMRLIRMCEPRNVMLVHGESGKMKVLAEKVEKEIAIPVFWPANGEGIDVATRGLAEIIVDRGVLGKRAAIDDRSDSINAMKRTSNDDINEVRPPEPQPFRGRLHLPANVSDASSTQPIPEILPLSPSKPEPKTFTLRKRFFPVAYLPSFVSTKPSDHDTTAVTILSSLFSSLVTELTNALPDMLILSRITEKDLWVGVTHPGDADGFNCLVEVRPGPYPHSYIEVKWGEEALRSPSKVVDRLTATLNVIVK